MGTVNGRTYAFVGLERIGGVMICDITDPSAVTFRNYVNSRNYSADIYDDVSPEGVIFVASEQNISGAPLVIASNEVSGTVSVTAPDMADDSPLLKKISTRSDRHLPEDLLLLREFCLYLKRQFLRKKYKNMKF